MSATRFETFRRGLFSATALALVALPTTGRAYTQEEQQACSGDAFRLCGPEIPDVDRVTACMVRNKDQLTPGCRVYFKPSAPEPAVRAGMPLSIKPVTSQRQ
jgi:hypothetical protein